MATPTDPHVFFSQTAIPDTFTDTRSQLEIFVEKHKSRGTKVVLVSSGGTTVPLESRTVRFIDNFSIGTRGASSAEYFLELGYAVIFLHRSRSLEPYRRHFSKLNILDILQVTNSQDVTVSEDHRASIKNLLGKYNTVMQEDRLLSVSFTALGEYLHILRAAAQVLHSIDRAAMLYLAAAVSDFYIPKEEMPEHKIQSSSGPLQLSLQMAPKMLKPLVKEWAPSAFIVSFKLETDESILIEKSRTALEIYQHQVVVANILETRRKEVTLVTKEVVQKITVSAEDLAAGAEIEKAITSEIAKFHEQFISGS